MIKPAVFLRVWETGLGLAWCEVEPSEFSAWSKQGEFERKWLFNGETATVYVCSGDKEITREIALYAANKHVRREVYELQFDLVKCEVKIVRPVLSHPR